MGASDREGSETECDQEKVSLTEYFPPSSVHEDSRVAPAVRDGLGVSMSDDRLPTGLALEMNSHATSSNNDDVHRRQGVISAFIFSGLGITAAHSLLVRCCPPKACSGKVEQRQACSRRCCPAAVRCGRNLSKAIMDAICGARRSGLQAEVAQRTRFQGFIEGNPATWHSRTWRNMPQYITDNTDDELSHAAFLAAFLRSKGTA